MSSTSPAFATAATHPAFAVVGPACEAHPKQAAALWQTYCDLAYAAHWSDLAPLPLPESAPWALLAGTPPAPGKHTAIFPVDLAAVLAPSDLAAVFAALPSTVDQDTIMLAVVSNDSTVVYYKLARGLVKPVN